MVRSVGHKLRAKQALVASELPSFFPIKAQASAPPKWVLIRTVDGLWRWRVPR